MAPMAEPVTGFRLAIRTRLYLDRRDSFGCTKRPCDCGQHLQLNLPDEIDGPFLTRFRHIVRLESMINVGCKFGPDDLDFGQWDDLITLAIERQWMDRQVDEQRDRIRDAAKKAEAALTEARKESGVPPPGQSLFPTKGR